MRVRRESRSEVVIGGDLVVVEVGLDGRVTAGGRVIGEVENTGRKIPRTSRWRARTACGAAATGYTAVEAAVALAYAVLRDRNPPEDVCPFCGAARDRCDCRPEDFGLDH